jgi:hypothetical protein
VALAAPAEPEAASGGWQRTAFKPHGSGVEVAYVAPPRLAPGQTGTVRLHFGGVTAADGAIASVRDPVSGRTLLLLHVASGEPREVDFAYTAPADGMQFLDVTTVQAGRTSVVSIPVPVGSGKLVLKSAGKLSISASGERVISMPSR